MVSTAPPFCAPRALAICLERAAAAAGLAVLQVLRLLLVLLAVVSPAGAQPAVQADPALELLRDRLDQQRRALQAAGPLLGTRRADQPLAPVPGESPCFVVRSVVLEAIAAPPAPAHLARALGAFEGACLGAQGIEQLRLLLQRRLAAAGWITSTIAVPPQSLADGRLHLQLHWGRLEAVQLATPDTTVPGAASATARPGLNALALEIGAPLNLRDLEQTLETLARLPSQAAQFHIAPGSDEGGSVVVISPQGGARWRAQLGFETTETPDSGPLQSQANLTLDAPLGLSDQLALVASWAGRGVDGHAPQQASLLVQHSLPWGRHLLSVNASVSRFRRSIVGGVGRFDETGADTQLQLRWQTTAWRDADARLSLWTGATWQHARADVDGTELLLRRRASSRADLGGTWFMQTDCGDLSIDLEGSRTVHLAHDEALQGPRPVRPSTWRAQAAWQCALDTGMAAGWQWAGRVWSQGTRHPAGSSDLALLGSQWTVRGHRPEGALSGQGATVLRQELLSPTSGLGPEGSWRAVLAADHGRIHQPAVAGGPRQLSGVALGLRWQWARWSGALTAAHAIGPRPPAPVASRGVLLHGSASVAF